MNNLNGIIPRVELLQGANPNFDANHDVQSHNESVAKDNSNGTDPHSELLRGANPTSSNRSDLNLEEIEARIHAVSARIIEAEAQNIERKQKLAELQISLECQKEAISDLSEQSESQHARITDINKSIRTMENTNNWINEFLKLFLAIVETIIAIATTILFCRRLST